MNLITIDVFQDKPNQLSIIQRLTGSGRQPTKKDILKPEVLFYFLYSLLGLKKKNLFVSKKNKKNKI